MKTESVSIEMRMPECYSDMHDSEKGLTGGTSEKEASTGELSKGTMIAAGGLTVAAVGMGIAGASSINNPNQLRPAQMPGVNNPNELRPAQTAGVVAGVALAVVGATAAIAGLVLEDD